jgi:DNA polymerase III delta prime subunit
MIADTQVLIKEFSRSNQPILIIETGQGQDLLALIKNDLHLVAENIFCFEPSEGVQALRLIINDLYSRPISSKLKFFEIKDINNLNAEQANTLLKLLEEPPEYLRILLRANNLSKILPTIKSRTKTYIFSGNQVNESEISLIKLLGEPFGTYCQEIAKLERSDFTNLLLQGIEERKENLLNKDDFRMLKLLSSSLTRVTSSNVNFKLIAEEIYLSQKE